MFVLRIVLLLLYCSMTVMTFGRGRNTRVAAEVKDEILETDDADAAYDLYLSSYSVRDGPAMLMAADPRTQQTERERKRVNFLKNLATMKEHNSKFAEGETRFKMTVNVFSVMDELERRNYLGAINATKSDGTTVALLRGKKYPESLSWHAEGYVTDSFDQGDCGSCWTFPAVALLEFAVKSATGKLIQLSNQQLLDCTYEYITTYGNHDGCEGGLYENAWDFVISKQHIAPLAKYSYREYDRKCDDEKYPNALENNVKITGYKAVPPNEKGVLEAIQIMPLAVAIFVEDDLYSYGKGLYDGCRRDHEDPDHAVLLTGYENNYWEIRNSWGPDWGINGYLKFYRSSGEKLCLLLDYAAYITYENLKEDTSGEATTAPPITDGKQTTTNTATTPSVTEETPKPTTPKPTTAPDKPTTTVKITNDHTTSSKVTTQALTTPYVEDCYPGYYWTGDGCKICSANFYSSYGSRSCISCPDGTFSKSGSTSVQDCLEPMDECTDAHDDCLMWSGYGFCTEGDYISFMENDCRKSCRFCVDHCDAGYYRGNDGECQMCPENTYSEYNSGQCTACPASTSSPEGSTDISNCIKDEVCEDTSTACNYYVPYGYCETRRSVMEEKCAKSCGYCTDDDTNDCFDIQNSFACQTWKKLGYCYDATFEELMRQSCGKTCGTCRDDEEDTGECSDEEQYVRDCEVWAQLGYCDATSEYAGFMRNSCKKSCDICQVTTDEPTQPPSVATEPTTSSDDCWISDSGISDNIIIAQPQFTTLDDCIDHCKSRANCKGVMVSPYYWAYRECFVMGEEVVESRFGFTAAKRSCFQPNYDVTTGEDVECADSIEYEDNCPDWANYHCESGDHLDFMKDHCRKSCGFCVVASSCSDEEQYATDCVSWANSGYCEYSSHSEWMMENCAQSCGACDEVVSVEVSQCSDSEEYAENCSYWADQDYCISGSYVQFMRENCPQTCGQCEGVTGGSTGGRREKGRGRGKGRGGSRHGLRGH